ncbi:outer mitochondrial membrane transport complex protein-domain-containing protein [Xylariaceae sp. FL0016]|nr:outer mitochondrial membrane transport complex protein-domain-containing protein [Xylariaceae sp. FL0016]
MAFELHVWGPAFGLDSIDAECLAAISLLRHVLAVDSWSLIDSNDPSLSPHSALPALCHGGTWTSGYANIVAYMKHHSSIDRDLTPGQSADVLAYSSFLAARGGGLLALSLYASHSAWSNMTRPAYSNLLPFPLTWTVPLAIRAAALEKADHLGLAYLAAEIELDESLDPVETTSTGFIRLRQSLSPAKAMAPEQTAAIRFRHLAEDFYSTLDHLRADKDFLLRDREPPTSLDFLAYGYLSLMHVETPRPVLKQALVNKHGYLLGLLRQIDVRIANATVSRRPPPPRQASSVIVGFASDVLENVPGAGEVWRRRRRGDFNHDTSDLDQAASFISLSVGSAIAGLATIGAAVFLGGSSPQGASTHRFEPQGEEKTGLQRFGEAGTMLKALRI